MATIQKLVKKYLKVNNWPEEEVTVGPGTCDLDCDKKHAYAKTVALGAWVYSRPCSVKKGW